MTGSPTRTSSLAPSPACLRSTRTARLMPRPQSRSTRSPISMRGPMAPISSTSRCSSRITTTRLRRVSTPVSVAPSLRPTAQVRQKSTGLFRSTFGWNEIFNTKAFSIGPLHNISFEVGMDANTENRFFGAAKRDVVGGLQFQFDLPYKGYFNVAPLVYWEFLNHNSFAQCNSGFSGPIPGVSCLFDGNTSFKPAWAVETNYYMDLGFLPPTLDYFSISGRLAWYGNKGTDTQPLPYNPANGVFNTAIEFNSEPIRLTMDVSKAIWGPKYTHFVDVWVAYRYWQNKFGLDHNRALACTATLGAVTVSNGSCTESSLYSGITVKF